MLKSWLPKKWMDKLITCIPPSVVNDANVFCFAGMGHNKFLVKDMYQELEGYPYETVDRDWKKNWKAEVPE